MSSKLSKTMRPVSDETSFWPVVVWAAVEGSVMLTVGKVAEGTVVSEGVTLEAELHALNPTIKTTDPHQNKPKDLEGDIGSSPYRWNSIGVGSIYILYTAVHSLVSSRRMAAPEFEGAGSSVGKLHKINLSSGKTRKSNWVSPLSRKAR